MSGRFADAAQRLCPLAAQRLGWRPEEFWRATPADLLLCLAPPPAQYAQVTRETLIQMMKDDHHG